MKFILKQEYGVSYLDCKKNNFLLNEPTYIDIDEKENNAYNLSLIQDTSQEKFAYYNNRIIKRTNKNIGNICTSKPIVMDINGNSYTYNRDLYRVEWNEGLSIDLFGKSYFFDYYTEVDPSTIQFIGRNLLLSLTKRQMVVIISPEGKILWSFGYDKCPGEDNKLTNPMCAVYSAISNTILISDTLNSRVIEVNFSGKIIWQYGIAGRLGSSDGRLWYPTAAKKYKNGDIVIADSKNNRLVIVSGDRLIHQIGSPLISKLEFTYPRSVQELSDGSIIIANTHKSNIYHITNKGFKNSIIQNELSAVNFSWPRCCLIVEDTEEMIIADGLNNQIIFLDWKNYNLKRIIRSNNNFSILDPHHIEINRSKRTLIFTISDTGEIVEIDSNGQFINKWTDFNDPHSCKLYEEGMVVANSGNSEFIVMRNDNSREIVNHYYSTGNLTREFNRPRFVLPYSDGFIVLNTGDHQILFISKKNGRWCGGEIEIDYSNSLLRRLNYPRWITITKNGDALVTDTENCRVLKFSISQ